MKAAEWIQAVAEKESGCSDYRIAKLLGISKQAVSKARAGDSDTLSDKAAHRVEKILGLPDGIVMIDQQVERQQDTEIKEVWKKIGAMVPRDRIELSTQGFSVLCSTD